jgi:hypothetical protein
VRLAASQVIERPPAEVFRFVATDHLQNHPKWDPAVTAITQTSPGPMGVGATARLVRTDRGRRVEGTMGSPSTGRSAASPRCPGLARSRCSPGEVGARRSGEHQAGAGDRYPRPWGDPVAAAADAGNLPQDHGQEPSHHQAGRASNRAAHHLIHLKPSGTSCMPYIRAQWSQDTAPASSYSSSGAARPGKRTSGWAARGASCLTQLG